jgi:hypothetical protein
LAAFGRRPRSKPQRRDRPASETLNNSGSRPKKKPPEGGFSIQLMIVDQAAINAGFDFRR